MGRRESRNVGSGQAMLAVRLGMDGFQDTRSALLQAPKCSPWEIASAGQKALVMTNVVMQSMVQTAMRNVGMVFIIMTVVAFPRTSSEYHTSSWPTDFCFRNYAWQRQ